MYSCATGFGVVLLFEEVLDAQTERASKADAGQHLQLAGNSMGNLKNSARKIGSYM
jgi:hypothetical protein